eukprot:CAMPEP_0176373238 /NCGR_PEP_ID=MMETSP0126-20121128/25905_1 /TAXON_ID=141414 ORGANISM="Strombidinopsis acuminatum, Strain SPMC142" /NCGR_SAMPLE_ID=MMETSP0126 /ASSEMBLY_ACC=CAM_ASM_000229 /LENGTH=62 /DNA_ID=CAMNT_0017733309 /DNA_START=391 /DNA_END=579 /DNA_ORIENTATION=+
MSKSTGRPKDDYPPMESAVEVRNIKSDKPNYTLVFEANAVTEELMTAKEVEEKNEVEGAIVQ